MAQNGKIFDIAAVQEVKEKSEIALLRKANVVGVGIGFKETKGKEKESDGPCLQVYVTTKVAIGRDVDFWYVVIVRGLERRPVSR